LQLGLLVELLLLRKRLEEILEESLESYGPVVAIGRPKEALAPLGAAREYASDDGWVSTVETRIREAQLIVAILGSTEGFAFEMSDIFRLSARGKLILVPPTVAGKQRSERWAKISKALHSEFELPNNAIMISWDDDRARVVTCPRNYQQAAGYRIGLACLLKARAEKIGFAQLPAETRIGRKTGRIISRRNSQRGRTRSSRRRLAPLWR
jgi:hypothetical protein